MVTDRPLHLQKPSRRERQIRLDPVECSKSGLLESETLALPDDGPVYYRFIGAAKLSAALARLVISILQLSTTSPCIFLCTLLISLDAVAFGNKLPCPSLAT
jgi:hypothetical protein